MGKYVLVINPGSTSTKIAVYCEEDLVFEDKKSHSTDDLKPFKSIFEQKDFRKQVVLQLLQNHQFDCKKLAAVCGRGGLLEPLKSGTYTVNEKMLQHLKEARRGEHASNLGAIIAKEIADPLRIPSIIVDPVAVDELLPIARISGIKELERTCIFHALNHKSTGRLVAKDKGVSYDSLNLIIAHLGGGISVGAHRKGQVIDVNNALDGDGPMSPERSGSLPSGPLYQLCFSQKYTIDQIRRMNYGQGGLVSYLGTNDAEQIVKRIEHGDTKAQLIYDAMIYQIAKEIGAIATVFKGDLDAIVLTGGLAHERYLVKHLIDQIQFLGEVLVYPGENECLSSAQGALRVINHEEIAKIY